MDDIEYEFDEAKSKKLRRERGFGFEEMITLIEAGHVIQTYDHPNQQQYPGQKIFEVNFEGYVWRVAHVKKENMVRLITCYPCRTATKKLRKKGSKL